MCIPYHTSTCIWLHFEEYYARGITPAQVREAIASVRNFGGGYLYPEPSGCNSNFNVNVRAKCPADVEGVVWDIAAAVERLVPEPQKSKVTA